jgi:hypothetical protein
MLFTSKIITILYFFYRENTTPQPCHLVQVKLTEPSEGFKITFHDHLETGNVGNKGVVVSPGLQYFIQLGYREVGVNPNKFNSSDKATYRY